MPLAPGTRLGPYEVVEPIGKGGMGEVYRAHDTKLDRDVAIKVLPDELASDEERVGRFEREAKLLASLNHPNIASIHGFEESDRVKALVLELVEGPTLAERIEQGPIPVDDAIAIAKQIAEALEAGHEAGVIHRDLKPANIKLKKDGTVKVLDYGLAKALGDEVPTGKDSELSQSPTLTRQGTQIGVILGTAAYMSPEQAKGKRVDKRTDVWAFGAVVYEMLTGKKAFAGADVSDTLAAVLRAEPDWDALPVGTSSPLRRALQLCLSKEPVQRVRDIADVRLSIAGAFETRVAEPEAGTRPRPALSVLVGTAVGAILGGFVVSNTQRPEPMMLPPARFELPMPTGVAFTQEGSKMVDISSDGTMIVFRANDQIYLRALGEIEAQPIRGAQTENGSAPDNPVLSPAGDWVGFSRGRELLKIPIGGGSPVRLARDVDVFGARWEADDTIVFADRAAAGIFRVSANGGTPERLVSIDPSEGTPDGAQMLHASEAVLFTLADSSWEDADLVAQRLGTSERSVLIEGARGGRYLSTGHLAYLRDGTIFVVPFDAERLETSGGAVPIVERVRDATWYSAAAHFSVSDSGSLVYVPIGDNDRRTLVWVDRNGSEVPLKAVPDAYNVARVSPDGTRVAVETMSGDYDVWVWELERETMTRLTSDPGVDGDPVWTPDGRRLAFSTTRDRGRSIFVAAADGSGTAEKLLVGGDLFPRSFTRDGEKLLFDEHNALIDVKVLSLDGTVEPLLATVFSEQSPSLSSDERWLAYVTNVSGRAEVYVSPFPNVDAGRWQISQGGGTSPVWSPDGSELFFMTPDGELMATSVDTEPTFSYGTPEGLFRGNYLHSHGARLFDIAPDGRRFLMIKRGVDEDGRSSEKLILVQNWFSELERLALSRR